LLDDKVVGIGYTELKFPNYLTTLENRVFFIITIKNGSSDNSMCFIIL